MDKLDNLTLKHFLRFELWAEAKRLLDFQIAQKKNNKFFNTFNFYYFERISKNARVIGEEKYFNEKVCNNIFYGLEKEMFFYHYTVPKQGMGLRKLFFFGYPMAVLQYAIGLYFLRLTTQFIKDHKRNNIMAYYGGDLQLDTASNKKLILGKKNIFYRKYYNSFKRDLINEARYPNDKMIVKLDIQNYFDSISISTLLKLIEENVKPSILKVNNFDETTKDLIEFYYRFLNSGKDGLPQGDNNIISDYISYLYLVFGDLIIEDTIIGLNKVSDNLIKEFKIIRYVDDTYISLKFKKLVNGKECVNKYNRSKFIYNLLNKIADEFYRKLHLRFNNKANLFKLEKPEEKDEFLAEIKKVSTNYPEAENRKETPSEIFIRILDILGKIKEEDIAELYKEPPKHLTEVLKDVYSHKVNKLIDHSSNAIIMLEKKFETFNFDLFRVFSQPLIILVNKTTNSRKKFEKFLLDKRSLTTFDRGLIIDYLCQRGFDNKKLIIKLKEDIQIEPIINKFYEGAVTSDKNTGYYNLNFSTCKKLLKQVSLIEQVRMRIYAEKTNQFSVCLNHLLNEFQLICCTLEGQDIKNYNANRVETYLRGNAVPNTIRTKIRNLFDRRNNNPVAHPGSDVRVAWSVSKSEYFKYKASVCEAINMIIKEEALETLLNLGVKCEL